MVYISFNQTTAFLGVVYAITLFMVYRKLETVWEREEERARSGLIMFTILFLFSVGAFSYVYYIYKTKETMEQQAVQVLDQMRETPRKIVRTNYFSKLVKVGSALLLSFISLHSILKKT